MLLDAARQLEAQGQRAAAQAVLSQLLQRFSDTPAGMEAALLRIEDGRVLLGVPGISPTVVKFAEGRRRPIYRPALSMPLFRAEF